MIELQMFSTFSIKIQVQKEYFEETRSQVSCFKKIEILFWKFLKWFELCVKWVEKAVGVLDGNQLEKWPWLHLSSLLLTDIFTKQINSKSIEFEKYSKKSVCVCLILNGIQPRKLCDGMLLQVNKDFRCKWWNWFVIGRNESWKKVIVVVVVPNLMSCGGQHVTTPILVGSLIEPRLSLSVPSFERIKHKSPLINACWAILITHLMVSV